MPNPMPNLRLVPIGHIMTGYCSLEECPRNIAAGLPHSYIHLEDRYAVALTGMVPGRRYDIVYWLDRGDRSSSCLMQTSHRTGEPAGVFTKCSPHRPNPIGLSRVVLHAIDGLALEVDGLDCLDGTPLLDIKPAVL
ncbi:MAG: SAM-dependent methyltransferase [Rhodospirillaceae bacterium]|jgi:tRNA (adenine37-N6)-methyltransferase|nr:SAM-dependent methyltransferase [Rhodospirillaceae bacterium]MBT6204703.1 SAM-dependent methyltransferase [Rhodospirillaceae bacterium]MBT7647102.1 SAM-dependent methyltransferase [Rhodospirillaceae bacterium]